MDAERARRAEVERGSDGLLGVEVYGAHHRDRLVGADRQRGETERTEAAPDLGEPREVAAVAREVESPRRTDDDPSAPERRALIGEAAPAPVLARYEMQLDAGDRTRVPPVELLDRGHAGAPEQIADAQRNEKARVPRGGEHPQRREVEVVVVVVRHEHEVDRRKIRERDRRRREAPWTEKRERARRARPNRIGEKRHVVHLHEHGRVPDPGDGRRAVPRVLAQKSAVVRDGGRRPRPPAQRPERAAEKKRHGDVGPDARQRDQIPKAPAPVMCWSIRHRPYIHPPAETVHPV